jgi:pimeloyl-ACP methyl ester carboxylesterase
MKIKKRIKFLICLIIGILLLIRFVVTKDKTLENLSSFYVNSNSQFMELDSRKIHFRDEGNGYPIILLHGTGSSLHTWDSWTAELVKNHRVIRLDLPGFGLTGQDPLKRYSSMDYVNLLDEFLNRLGINEFHLAGNSLGGQVAWLYTSKFDHKINKLLLLDPSGFSFDKVPFVIQLAKTPLINSLLRYFTPRSFIKKNLKEVYFNDSLITPELISRYHSLTLFEGNRSAFIDRANIKRKDYSSRMKYIQTPTLIIWGENDFWIPVGDANKFENAIENSKVIIMPETGHIPMEERPKESLRIALDFIRL